MASRRDDEAVPAPAAPSIHHRVARSAIDRDPRRDGRSADASEALPTHLGCGRAAAVRDCAVEVNRTVTRRRRAPSPSGYSGRIDQNPLTIEVRGHVLLAGLNRVSKRNAFNLRMLRER